MHYILVLCHSTSRCEEITEFLTNLLTFCKDVIEVLNLSALFNDTLDNLILLRQSMDINNEENMKEVYKARCKIIVSTPNKLMELL